MAPILLNLFDLTNPWFWILSLLAFYLFVFIVYALSRGSDKVVVTTPLPGNTADEVEGDLLYYLPSASLTLNAKAVTKGERLLSLTITPSVNLEADTTVPYLLKYKRAFSSNDELEVKVDDLGLMENIKVVAEDRLSQTIALIATAAGSIVDIQETANIKALEIIDQQPKDGPIEEHEKTFRIPAEELLQGTIMCEWRIVVKTYNNSTGLVDAGFRLTKPAISLRHLSPVETRKGILVRPLLRQTVEAESSSGKSKFEILIPDAARVVTVPIKRAWFVKKTQQPKFNKGFLIENHIEKPSELEAFVSIPINILKSIISIPAQLFSFRINLTKKETDMVKATEELRKAEQALKKQIDANEKDNVQPAGAPTTEAGTSIQAAAKPDRLVIPDAIFIEAIKKEGNNWKGLYNLLEVGFGYKEKGGKVSNVKSLIFRPLRKLSPDQVNEVPSVIEFNASDGHIYRLPTDVQASDGEIVPAFDYFPNEDCTPGERKLPGCSISRIDSTETGTISLRIYQNSKPMLLTCYHVICYPEMKKHVRTFRIEDNGEKRVISPGRSNGGNENHLIGTVLRGELSSYMDAAIAEIDDVLDFGGRICRTDLQPTETLTVDSDYVNYRVYMSGQKSKFRSTTITSSYCNPDIKYPGGSIRMEGLISTKKMARSGDSGSPVFDDDGRVIGIVIAISGASTYILPINRILAHFDATIQP